MTNKRAMTKKKIYLDKLVEEEHLRYEKEKEKRTSENREDRTKTKIRDIKRREKSTDTKDVKSQK